MPEVQNTSYLSIGEVLGLLLAEFPDITISKIRFLESQGLIAPERTPSGYRKFYEPDVELLKVILREQRENYLPLRVIKDRIDSGAIDPSGEMAKPEGVADHTGEHAAGEVRTAGEADITAGVADDVTTEPEVYRLDPDRPAGEPGAELESERDAESETATGSHDELAVETEVETEVDVPAATVAAHPANRPPADPSPPPERGLGRERGRARPQLLPGVLLEAGELCAMTGITAVELAELRSYGIVSGRDSGGTILYGDDAVEISKVAGEFLRAGVDARHLRGWRTAAEREASLFEQLITPRLRQRNPESRSEALDQLRRLDGLGARLRSALMRTALRHHFEG